MASEDTNEPVIQYAKDNLLEYGLGESTIVSTVGTFKCYIQSIGVASEGESKTYKDNTGQTCALVIPETWQTLQCEGLMIKDGNSGQQPKKGDEVQNLPAVEGMLTGANIHWRIESFNTSWSNEDVTKVSMQVRSYKF